MRLLPDIVASLRVCVAALRVDGIECKIRCCESDLCTGCRYPEDEVGWSGPCVRPCGMCRHCQRREIINSAESALVAYEEMQAGARERTDEVIRMVGAVTDDILRMAGVEVGE